MITFLEKIKEKINKEFKSEQILLIDNSNLHNKHKSFDSNKFYLALIIKSEKLKNMKKIDAHKAIFSILKKEMKNKIHALEIKIK
ncbi:MAG TPA: BolA/IbaG family iron-sulfur metabolism protein [Pelagibacteraceae bacterium]|jgi:stress-induced morphogen|nr:BolA/IbaG family iron-sulfur metabolism protein [Pelagibacteraceae bacterium]|tara:strand:+ start:6246 stop:6500 length:255 start_codon:yes stop_codon:yes gene_type:complete